MQILSVCEKCFGGCGGVGGAVLCCVKRARRDWAAGTCEKVWGLDVVSV